MREHPRVHPIAPPHLDELVHRLSPQVGVAHHLLQLFVQELGAARPVDRGMDRRKEQHEEVLYVLFQRLLPGAVEVDLWRGQGTAPSQYRAPGVGCRVSERPIAPPAQLYLWRGGSRREPATSTRSPVRRGVFARGCRDSATIPSSRLFVRQCAPLTTMRQGSTRARAPARPRTTTAGPAPCWEAGPAAQRAGSICTC